MIGYSFLHFLVANLTFIQNKTPLLNKADIFDSSIISSLKTKVSSIGPDVSRAKKYVYITGASYCFDVHKWSCPYCKKAKTLGFEYADTVFNSVTNTFGLMTVNKADKEIILSFRGTFNVDNVLVDWNIAQTNPDIGGGSWTADILTKLTSIDVNDLSTSSLSSTIAVNAAFLNATNLLFPKVVQKLGELLEQHRGYSVVFLGHSLGAALASIMLYKFQQKDQLPDNFPEPASYAFFSYGGPRVGNKAYADYWNKQKIPITRIANKADPVPHLHPSFYGYMHHGTELWITPTNELKSCSKSKYEDNTCANSLKNIYSLIDHIIYWDVAYLSCALNNPIPLLKQFVLPLSEYHITN